MKTEIENPHVLVYEGAIRSSVELLPILTRVSTTGRPLLVIAEEVDPEALAALATDRLQGEVQVYSVRPAGFGDRRKAMLQYIAILTGGRAISESPWPKLQDVELAHLGRASKAIINEEVCTIVKGGGLHARPSRSFFPLAWNGYPDQPRRGNQRMARAG